MLYYTLPVVVCRPAWPIYSSSFVEIDSKKNKQTNIYKQNTKIAMKSTEILTLRNYEGWSKSFEPDVDGHKTVG